MSILDQTGFIERLRFFDGQRLFAEDLQGIEEFHREMRWLHNRSLHQPGIGNGFAVTGRRDEREVQVGAGYALDALGREIVLTRDRVEPVPPVSSESNGDPVFFDLAVSYPGDELLEEAETREGICLPRGVVRLREEPVLCWVQLRRDFAGRLTPDKAGLRQEIQDGLRIVLARIEVLECRLRQDVSLAERRSARPARQPYLACGSQPLTWTELQVAETLIGLTADVDTSSAGFLTTPCYSVRLDGDRVVTEGQSTTVVFDSPPNVLAPSPAGFKVNVLVSTTQGDATPWNDWRAVWMGVE
jgi:hypothetical protein